MEIKIENVKAAFNTADESGKKLLLALFPELSSEPAQKADNRPVTERIKTFEDACIELGADHPLVLAYKELIYLSVKKNVSLKTYGLDMIAYMKLRIICAALNEGWIPQFIAREHRYFPMFWLFSEQLIQDTDENEKIARHLIPACDYRTGYAGFASAFTGEFTIPENARAGAFLCLKSEALATYCANQFIDIWADFCLIRR